MFPFLTTIFFVAIHIDSHRLVTLGEGLQNDPLREKEELLPLVTGTLAGNAWKWMEVERQMVPSQRISSIFIPHCLEMTISILLAFSSNEKPDCLIHPYILLI